MSEHCLLLRKDLSQPPEPAQWPDEVTLVTLNAALLQPVHDLLVQGYARAKAVCRRCRVAGLPAP